MRLWYAPYLELLDGAVLKGAMLVATRPSDQSMVVQKDVADGLWAFGGGACVEGGGDMVVVYELRLVCRRHAYIRGNTTDRGIAVAGRAGDVVALGVRLGNTTTPIRVGYLVGMPILFENSTAAGRGGDVVGLDVSASSVGGGLVGIGHGSGNITLPEGPVGLRHLRQSTLDKPMNESKPKFGNNDHVDLKTKL
ncbi:hypothetical protein Tco_0471950 [Tanacetum coccineum]